MKNNQLVYIVFAMWLICFAPGLLRAQKPKPPSKAEMNEIIRTELERYRALYQTEHERAGLQAEQAQIYKTQLERLRSAVAKAAKL